MANIPIRDIPGGVVLTPGSTDRIAIDNGISMQQTTLQNAVGIFTNGRLTIPGGATGQVLIKSSAVDYAVEWATVAAATAVSYTAQTLSAPEQAQARTNIGLGSMATQSASGVAITGGSISNITDLAVVDGGTGASTAAAARTNLGLTIGSNVQAYDVRLSEISATPVDIASAATTDIGASTSQNVRITGTTTITALGTVAAGTFRRLTFAASLTLTHNATSLILPGSANIVTAAGDVAEFVSLGSGNWRCVAYTRASGAALVPTGWVSLLSGSYSSVSEITQTGLSAYRRLKIGGLLRPATDGVNLTLRTSTNNGSSYDSGVSDYGNTRLSQQFTGVSGAATSSSSILINQGITVGNAANEGVEFNFILDEFNQAQWAFATGNCVALDTSGAGFQEQIGGFRQQATARNALRLAFSSGNIASGFITIEGWVG